MATANPLFAPIAKHRITPSTPPNAKYDHDLDKQSWWSRHGSQSLLHILQPSLVRYLGKIFDVPDHVFFYHLRGLAGPGEMLQLGDVLEEDGEESRGRKGEGEREREGEEGGKYRFVVLYGTCKALVSHPAGLV
ncbi:hypothetical protein B0A55_09321 [Friedmanniomyces simplex]|uniref:Uncharacterized protein n=1 Tax=Friedmanniomyces simplex TaxID=329884 RepID=A0A4U0WZ20_9PEZI|nr:hypothetical protein B0A55_09321 [Friedmanniomyces simplex]